MRRLSPADIPPQDSRHDFVVVRVGEMKVQGENVPAAIVEIASGDFQGKKIAVAGDFIPGDTFAANIHITATAFVGGEWVKVPLDYRDSNPRLRYALYDMGRVSPPAAVHVPDPRAKFRRATPA